MLQLTKEDLTKPGNYEGYETLLDFLVCEHPTNIDFLLLYCNSIPELIEHIEKDHYDVIDYVTEDGDLIYADRFSWELDTLALFELMLIALDEQELYKMILNAYIKFRIREIGERDDSIGLKLEEVYDVILDPKIKTRRDDVRRVISIMLTTYRYSNLDYQRKQEEKEKQATSKIERVFQQLRQQRREKTFRQRRNSLTNKKKKFNPKRRSLEQI